MSPGDIVISPNGGLWVVISASADIVRAEHIDTGVVSHFDIDDLTKETP